MYCCNILFNLFTFWSVSLSWIHVLNNIWLFEHKTNNSLRYWPKGDHLSEGDPLSSYLLVNFRHALRIMPKFSIYFIHNSQTTNIKHHLIKQASLVEYYVSLLYIRSLTKLRTFLLNSLIVFIISIAFYSKNFFFNFPHNQSLQAFLLATS